MPRNGVSAYLDDGYSVENPDEEVKFDDQGNVIIPYGLQGMSPADTQGIPGMTLGRGVVNQLTPPEQQVPDSEPPLATAPPTDAPTGTQGYGDDEHEIGPPPPAPPTPPATPAGPTAPGNQFGDLGQRSITKILGDGTKQNPGPPVMQTPKWWERAIAGGIGAAAGWSNAASRARTPIDIKAATEGILHPGYAEKMAQYQSQIPPLEKATEIAGQVGAYGQKMAMDAATIDHLRAQAELARNSGKLMKITPELAALSKNTLHVGDPDIPYQVGLNVINDSYGRYQRNQADRALWMQVTDPEMAKRLHVPLGGMVPTSTFNTDVRATDRTPVRPPVQRNLNPEDILLRANEVDANGKRVFTSEQVQQAQMLFDKMHRPPQNTFSINTLTPDAVDQAARLYLATGHLDSYSSGPAGAQMRSTVMNRAAEISKAESNGGPPVDLAANRIDFQATQASVKDLTRTLARVASSEGTTSKNLDLAASVSTRVDRFGSPFFNKYLLWTKGKLAGDDDTQLLSNAVETAANEYANVVTAGTGGGTAATDASRQHARDMLSAAMADGTFLKVVAQMKVEMGNRKKSINEQLQALRNPQRNQNETQPLFDGNVKTPPGNSKPAGNIMDRWGYKPGKK